MFSGIIQNTGTLKAIENAQNGKRFVIDSPLDTTDCVLGDSIAINGVCLTLVEKDALGHLHFDVGPETLSCTTFHQYRQGQVVNLEKALRFQDRISGHLVQGHVDGIGKIENTYDIGESKQIEITISPQLISQCVEKGSICIDGVSLTINKIQMQTIHVCIIPHTRLHTNLNLLSTGHTVNIETDILGKYFLHWFSRHKGVELESHV